MNFKEYWKSRDPENYIGFSRVTARDSWNAAMTACAEMLEKEAAELRIKFVDSADVYERIDAKIGEATLLNAVIKIREEIANS